MRLEEGSGYEQAVGPARGACLRWDASMACRTADCGLPGPDRPPRHGLHPL